MRVKKRIGIKLSWIRRKVYFGGKRKGRDKGERKIKMEKKIIRKENGKDKNKGKRRCC